MFTVNQWERISILWESRFNRVTCLADIEDGRSDVVVVLSWL